MSYVFRVDCFLSTTALLNGKLALKRLLLRRLSYENKVGQVFQNGSIT
jgi:hypothetical protein